MIASDREQIRRASPYRVMRYGRVMRPRGIAVALIFYLFLGVWVLPFAFTYVAGKYFLRWAFRDIPRLIRAWQVRKATTGRTSLDTQVRDSRKAADDAIAAMKARKLANLNAQLRAGIYSKATR